MAVRETNVAQRLEAKFKPSELHYDSVSTGIVRIGQNNNNMIISIAVTQKTHY